MINSGATLTCLDGLALALKWAGRTTDSELARCTAYVAHACAHRHDCPCRHDCDQRLHALDDWLAGKPDA